MLIILEYVGMVAESDGTFEGDIKKGVHHLMLTEMFRGKFLQGVF